MRRASNDSIEKSKKETGAKVVQEKEEAQQAGNAKKEAIQEGWEKEPGKGKGGAGKEEMERTSARCTAKSTRRPMKKARRKQSEERERKETTR